MIQIFLKLKNTRQYSQKHLEFFWVHMAHGYRPVSFVYVLVKTSVAKAWMLKSD